MGTFRVRGLGLVLLAAVGLVSGIAEGSVRAAEPVTVASTDLPVSGVLASDDDGQNFAPNTRDNDLSTRWSGFGDGVWIRFDLGSSVSVHHLRVAWYHGDERVASFDVQTSADATTWATRWTGQSSGTTTAFETVDFADVTARYVRIVGHGNTVSDWTSITELDVFGESPGGYDANGVRQIYRSATGRAAPWVLGYADGNGVGWWDRAVRLPGKWLDDDNVDLTISGSGKNTVVTAGGSQIRLYVAATPFAPDAHCDGDNDLDEVLARGYMCSSTDWRNYEISGYFQLVTPSGADHRSWQVYGGGGRHSDASEHRCKGTAYKARLHYGEGWVQLRKEGPHPEYSNRTFSGRKAPDYTLSGNRSKWLGMKLVRYELTRNSQRIVRLEMYLDTTGIDASGNPANAWQLVASTEDTGGWGNDLDLCGVSSDQIMLWGGPWIGYRWDDTTSRIRLMTIREIQPGQKW